VTSSWFLFIQRNTVVYREDMTGCYRVSSSENVVFSTRRLLSSFWHLVKHSRRKLSVLGRFLGYWG